LKIEALLTVCPVLFIMAKFRHLAKKILIIHPIWRKEGAFQYAKWVKHSPYGDGLLIA
jgi:hypothetical protein